MSRNFNVIIERDSEGYCVGTVPALKGCHTQASDGLFGTGIGAYLEGEVRIFGAIVRRSALAGLQVARDGTLYAEDIPM